MKLNKLIYLPVLSITFSATLTCGISSCTKKAQKKPAKIERCVVRRPELRTRIDTIEITDDNYRQKIKHSAAGVFFPTRNMILINYFVTNSHDQRLIDFCNQNNANYKLVMRHEQEHARKAHLTKTTDKYPPHIRGQIAAMNEIMAPAGEIIEALEYRNKIGMSLKTNRTFVTAAEKEITQHTNTQRIPIIFHNTYVANTIIKHATERFLSELNRGIYKTTIRREIKKKTQFKAYEYYAIDFGFHPQAGIWDSMWEFETSQGRLNLWALATLDARMETIQKINAEIDKITSENVNFLTISKTR